MRITRQGEKGMLDLRDNGQAVVRDAMEVFDGLLSKSSLMLWLEPVGCLFVGPFTHHSLEKAVLTSPELSNSKQPRSRAP